MYDSRLAQLPSTLGFHWACTGVHMNVTHKMNPSVRQVMTAAVDLRVQVTAFDVLNLSRRKATDSLTPHRVIRYMIWATKKACPQRGSSWAGSCRSTRCRPPPCDIWTGTIAAKIVNDAWKKSVSKHLCFWFNRRTNTIAIVTNTSSEKTRLTSRRRVYSLQK